MYEELIIFPALVTSKIFKVCTSSLKLLSCFAGNYQKKIQGPSKFFLYWFANTYYTEKVYASSNKVVSLFAAKYRKNTVAVEVILKFVDLETLIIQKLIKNLIIIFWAKFD